MKTVSTTYESDASGNVRVDVAVGGPHRQVDVVVVWHDAALPVGNAALAGKRAELEALAGVLADEPMERPAQPSPKNWEV